MSELLWDYLLYAGAMVVLVATPGPVWVAVTARTLSGGSRAALPLALGVALGDMLWPFLAILGVTWVVSVFDGFLTVLRWVAAGIFLFMGWSLITHADREVGRDTRLTRPGNWAGFVAGVAAILGNPKAILFYMGVLPGFFDLAAITPTGIAAVVLLSAIIPFAGNMALALLVGRLRARLTRPGMMRRTNLVAGSLLICVGLAIPFL